MGQEDKLNLSSFTKEQVEEALLGVDAIYERAAEFLKGLGNEDPLKEILKKAFDAIDNIIRTRHDNRNSPTNFTEIQKLFAIQDDLEGQERKNSNDSVAYDALFDFIKSARIIAFLPGESIRKGKALNLRDLAMDQADIPKEKLF